MSVLRYRTADEVAAAVADALVAALVSAQAEDREPSVVLTGGTIARKVHAAVAGHPERDRVDWSRVHLWWGDERFVPADDDERNEGQARADLVDRLPFDPAKVHAVAAADGSGGVEDAAAAYAAELESALSTADGPWFDVLMLGIGPDGHCASLFPGRPEVDAAGTTVAVRDSPKPPPERVSLTMATLQRASEVWFVAAGEGKADAVARSVAGGDVHETPSAGPRGTDRTRWYVDEAAASRLDEVTTGAPTVDDGDEHPAVRLHDGYFADPFVLRTAEGYLAYGTNPERSAAGADGADDGREFVVLSSADLLTWRSHGGALERPDPALGSDYWAPEVAHAGGRWWMFYSVGHDIAGHHVRVAVADDPLGPFSDLGVNLTPDERFAIDPHPFQDADGRWYLFFARDVLEAERPGTHLAVAPLEDMTRLGPVVEVLRPYADWQIYERDRAMYGATYDWHTLEGPSVVRRGGRYWLTYSGGAWTGEGYAVSWAVADSPLGPWSPAPASAPALLRTSGDLIGPGHNSLTVDPNGDDVIVFHSWNAERTRREMHARRIVFGEDGPRVDGPLRGAGPRAQPPPSG